MPENKWISVEEKLPVPYVPVLVWREPFFGTHGYADVDHVVKNTTSDACSLPLWNGDLTSWTSCVSFWQPLPKGPAKRGAHGPT